MNFLLASHRVGSLLGFEVRVAYSLYLVTAFFALSYLGQSAWAAVGVIFLPVFVLLHEMGHSVAARAFGVPVDGITLYMLGGVARLNGRIPGPKAELVIAAAGPLVSILLAGVGLAGLFTLGGALHIIALYVFWMNIMLGVFNLLPVFPMDGGRIALALAVMAFGVEKGLRLIRPLAAVGAGLICLYGCYQIVTGDTGGLFLILIGAMLYFQGAQELQGRQYAQQYLNHLSAYRDMEDYRQGGWDGGSGLNPGFGGTRGGGMREVPARDITGKYSPAGGKKDGFFRRLLRSWRVERELRQKEKDEELNRRVDEVLAKVKAEGTAALTPGERALLLQASEKYRKQN